MSWKPLKEQGQGNGTRRKQKAMVACFRQSLLISRRLPGDYTHIDLTSGCGRNDHTGCLGSPVEFAKLAIAMKRQSRLFCCDSNLSATETLRAELSQIDPSDCQWHVECRDNADYLRRLATLLCPDKAYGSLVCDPNGPRSGYPRQLLTSFAATFPRIDLVITFNVNFYRSIDPTRSRDGRKPSTENALITMASRYGTVNENLQLLAPFRQWWISNPSMKGGFGHAYIVCLGRTMQTAEPPSRDFLDAATDEGKARLKSLTYNDGQGYLFPIK